ncbi:MAG: aminotransferase class III-fold pyridoxal phosphate-dependent enzyme [Myxococcales bacterium]|nr:aminotransferase class III-fold pyridoxal phosphate-dependent enzyme [Myxococcales bacterium]
MSQLELTPNFEPDELLAFVQSTYGLSGALEALPSERDQNFRLTVDDGRRFVLKVAHGGEAPGVIEAQHQALAQIAESTRVVPSVLTTVDGRPTAMLTSTEGLPHLVRIVSWVEGTPLASAPHAGLALVNDLGRSLAQLDAGLAGFDHPALRRGLDWDLTVGLEVVDRYAPAIADDEHRSQVQGMARRVRRQTWPGLQRARRQVIHGDANDHNVIVHPTEPRVVGLIDFGDMVHSWLVGDVAIAAAYAVLDASEPLDVLAALVAGYHEEMPLRADELDAVYGLMCLRLCVSAVMAAQQAQQRPDDPYLQVSQAPLRRTLPKLLERPDGLGRQAVRDAAAIPWSAPVLAETSRVAQRREAHVGSSLSLGYERPVHLRRGFLQYLFDADGTRLLDAYNNVPHVGHCHPAVVDAAVAQQRRLATNTRYLCDALPAYAEALAATFPEPLSVCFFLNSATEANELALRLARAATGQRDTIVLEAGYHGHTTSLVDCSHYKHAGPGGQGAPDWVGVALLPDLYRGPFRADDPAAADHYAASVSDHVARIDAAGRGVCAFLAETCPSVGGQHELPATYLSQVYAAVRAAGGVCIADEVQTGFGRLGDVFYAFEHHGVVPDIVVLGKPIGNGHPLAAVVTRPEIARAFDNGMEFFSTFGGNTVSCEVGLAVLEVLRTEGLQAHAQAVGAQLLGGLAELAERYPAIGDVRGRGLFLGVELVADREARTPDAARAAAVSNALRRAQILIGTDGPDHNVLKIRPPMPFDKTDAALLLTALDEAMAATRS